MTLRPSSGKRFAPPAVTWSPTHLGPGLEVLRLTFLKAVQDREFSILSWVRTPGLTQVPLTLSYIFPALTVASSSNKNSEHPLKFEFHINDNFIAQHVPHCYTKSYSFFI